MESKTSSGGIGFGSLLTIAFIVLKLTKQIDWPWLWVLSPVWIVASLIVVIVGFFAVVGFIIKRL